MTLRVQPGGRGGPWPAHLLAVLGVALIYRLLAVTSFPMVFDEVGVMAYGLAKAFHSGTVKGLLFETPITVSNGITPFWFWAQSLPAAVFGEVSKAGLRTLPVALGLLGVGLAYRAAEELAGKRAGLLAALLYGAADLLVYTNSRGEFAESLLALLCLLLLLDLMPRSQDPPRLRSACWPALALFTHLGKGLLIWIGYVLYLTLLWGLARYGRRVARPTLARVATLALAPLVPSLLWLAAAQVILFAGGVELVTDLGSVRDVWQNVYHLTIGYGVTAKAFMISGWRDALYVYTDFRAWPTLCLIAIPSLITVVGLTGRLVRGLRDGHPRETTAALLPLCLVLPTATVIVAKGVLDARFHLLYLAFLIPYVGAALDGWICLAQEGRGRAFLSPGIAGCLYLGWTLSRSSASLGGQEWRRGAVAMGVGAGLLLGIAAIARRERFRAWAGLMAVTLWCALLVSTSLAFGPLQWGKRWAWEPSPVGSGAPREVASFGNADLQLALCFMSRDGAGPARFFLLRALARHPDDPVTLYQAGEMLLNSGRKNAEIVVQSLNGYARRHPEDHEMRALLARALAVAQKPGP